MSRICPRPPATVKLPTTSNLKSLPKTCIVQTFLDIPRYRSKPARNPIKAITLLAWVLSSQTTPPKNTMVDLSRYWKLVRMSGAGDIIIEVVPAAQGFLQQHFSQPDELSDSAVQRRLLEIYQVGSQVTGKQNSNQSLAELCLRCFVSGQIQQSCLRIEAQFGSRHGFNRRDLLMLVLDEMPLQRQFRGRTDLAAQPRLENTLFHRILQTFNPDRGSLSTWTARMVQSHPELDRFLLNRGVYQVSDWAILNSYQPKRLRRILSDIDHLPDSEIAQTQALLESYHEVYRGDRQLNGEATSSQRCHPPTETQLERIADLLQQRAELRLSAKTVLSRLLKLAERLRQHSIWVRGGPPPSASIDLPEVQAQVDQVQIQQSTEPDEQLEFLQQYQQQLSQCLEQSLEQVLQDWSAKLRQKTASFLTALRLFYCRGMAMGEIAPLIGLDAQYQVTRLLKLKAFRADVRHHLLEQLRHSVLHLAKEYAHPDRLQRLDQEIDLLLDAEIEKVVEGCPIQSVFAKQLCQQIEASQG